TARAPLSWTPTDFLIAGVLVLSTLGVYSHAALNEFVNYDDTDYVLMNTHVQAPLSWAAVKWACLASDACNWHPLTWLSLQLDFNLYGLWNNPAVGFHLTSVLF